jgi:type I restriction enzyme R subunit
MPKIITEDMIEQAAIKALEESQGYGVLRCYTEDPETLPETQGRSE